ncbi:MAG: hypothetical protein GVY29_09595 [Spirochaetes bacterium]|jgi:uncharacterized protein YbjQ (UPF0145 family)|nr:hypothetical protein [Spirochaetota bacterium]
MIEVLTTTEQPPAGSEIKQVFDMIQVTGSVEISKKGLIRQIKDRKRNYYQELLDGFAAIAPEEANAIIGARLATSVATFSNGTFLMMTYTGTPVIIGYIEG